MAGKSNEDLFGGAAGPVHPRLRRWRLLKDEYPLVEMEVRRPWDGLTYAPAKMFVTFRKTAKDAGQLEEALWEDELNQGLIELGVRAIDPSNEAVRYSLAMKSALAPVSLRHGQDYVRSVLVEDLRERELGTDPVLAEVLDQVRVHRPQPGPSFEQVLDAIDGILRSKARELEANLKYPRKEAANILACALAQQVDEIFHLKARAIWFGKR